MNPHVKRLWIDDLESGIHKQITGMLFNGGGFCCLGRLCDLYAAEHPGYKWWVGDPVDDTFIFGNTGAETCLPECVVEWAGLSETDPVIKRGDEGEEDITLAALNDSGHSFVEIAQIIRDNL